MKSYFCDNLKDAIIINSERAKLYAQMSSNRSLWVSWPLILLEKAAIPIASVIDRKALKFQKMGIPIIKNDVVEMLPLPSYDTAPLYCKQADRQILRAIAKDQKKYHKSIKGYVDNENFMTAAKVSYDFLQHIRQIERQHQCHFAMTRHLIESIGFALLHVPQYVKASNGATLALSKAFVQMQTGALSAGLWLDKQAGVMHKMGIGILVNDVPLIPFEEEFQNKMLF